MVKPPEPTLQDALRWLDVFQYAIKVCMKLENITSKQQPFSADDMIALDDARWLAHQALKKLKGE